MTASLVITLLAGIIATLQGVMIGLILRLGARVTRIETRLDEQDRTQRDRRRGYDRDAQDQARAVCGGIHECYFREPTGVRTMPREP